MAIDPILIFEDNYAKCFCTSFEDEKIIRLIFYGTVFGMSAKDSSERALILQNDR